MKKAYVCNHQGWTDIVCFLPQLNYYSKFYDELTVFYREESKDLVEFYIKDLDKVNAVFVKTDNGANLFQYTKPKFIKTYDHVTAFYEPSEDPTLNDYDFLFHGQYDIMRKDKYRYASRGHQPGGYDFFVECFYERYGIDYQNRISCFEISRDKQLEEQTYSNFIKDHGENYIVYHDMPHSAFKKDTRNTRIQFANKLDGYEYVNLHKKTNTFFDYIKVIQNSKEVHLIDSVWAAICYQLDSKYSLFSHLDIKVYCKRGHNKMFYTPKKLDNWTII
tara:strand:- start:2128 stop:2955 length:828 start_codon:yes stop_codon:yes gene_type:complete